MIASIFLSFVLLFQTPFTPQQRQQQQGETPRQTTASAVSVDMLNIPTSETKHTITVGGRQLNYTAKVGYMPINNSVTGETEAKIFYTAYTLDNPSARRPLTFAFNGGPGSASVWLHMGALGPKRVKMLDSGLMPAAPYEIVDNEGTWLTDTDIVFVDTVGTGYSRATKPEFGTKFFGLDGDIQSTAEFIRMYLGRENRWASPLFLAGESYGTTRVSGLSNYLFEKGIGLNGILMISTVMNFETIRFADNNDLPLVLILPSYTTTAWYHKKLPAQLQSKSVKDVAQEAEEFATNEYMPAMLKLDRLSSQEKQALGDKLARYTGLSRQFFERNNYRVDLDEFMKELLRDQRRTTGRLDSRFTGIDRDAAGSDAGGDPSMNAIRPPYNSVFNNYVRGELGFKSDLEYYVLGGGIGRWNWGTDNGYADTSMRLKDAMAKNPYMKVFIGQGYYDMATPFFAAEYTVSAMNLEPELRKNISFSYYESGHMMYIERNSLRKLKDDAVAFINSSIPK